MDSIIITPSSEHDLQFIDELLNKMKMKYIKISAEKLEDSIIASMLKDIDRTKKVPTDQVLAKLRGN